MKDFILKQQLPDIETAVKTAEANLETWSKSGESVKHAHNQQCTCPHLHQHLPVTLDLDLYKCVSMTTTGGWVLADPVHALHLSSQLDEAEGLKNTNTISSGQAPVLYGEEQERTMVMQTKGLPEAYHPFLKEGGAWEESDDEDKIESEGIEDQIAVGMLASGSNSHRKQQPTASLDASTTGPVAKDAIMKDASTMKVPLPFPKASTAPTAKGVAAVPTSAVRTGPKPIDVTSKPTVGINITATATTGVKEQPSVTALPAKTVVPSSASTVLPNAALSSTRPPFLTEAAKPAAPTAPQPLAVSKTVSSVGITGIPTVAGTTTTAPPVTSTTVPPAVASALQQKPTMQPDSTVSTSAPPPTASSSKPVPARTTVGTASTAAVGATTTVPGSTTSAKGSKGATAAARTKPSPLPATAAPPVAGPSSPPDLYQSYELADSRYYSLNAKEDQIRSLRRSLMSKRAPIVKKKVAQSSLKKRKNNEGKPLSLVQLPAWKPSATVTLTEQEERDWHERYRKTKTQVELWMEHYRLSRQVYWEERRRSKQRKTEVPTFGAIAPEQTDCRSCEMCCMPQDKRLWRCGQSNNRTLSGDDLMQCLECSFVGCAPNSVAAGSGQHILQHLLLSNHKFAVTCGPKAAVYCFKCGDFVYHEIFDQEKERLDLVEKLPSQAWKSHPVQRSFDALRFLHIQDEGIIWKGMIATYPSLVPQEHVHAARLCRKRQMLFKGELDELSLMASPNAKSFAALNSQKASKERWRIKAPVGMYNLGNTCFQTAILQCLINCVPLQRYFLHDIGHHHMSCEAYRELPKAPSSSGTNGTPSDTLPTAPNNNKKDDVVCLACEMDKMFLKYFGSTIGVDVAAIVAETKQDKERRSLVTDEEVVGITKGQPLITSDMLTAAWKCGGMDHLAGYEQRDAHEFLHAFLENLGKHARQYRERVYKKINSAVPDNAVVVADKSSEHDVIKNLFEGTLRSVLMCQDCGNKRVQSEPFMSLSLPLSKEAQKATNEMPGESNEAQGRVKISVERCLRHFTIPEMLADPVDCPSCGKKTPTKKQHVVSKLPRVLCLHLKRFDAAQNKKIEDFVSFPAKGLNMGPHLPHWCEVTRVQSPDDSAQEDFTPEVLFDLFGTVNHYGNLQSGHYVTNVKVDNKWFHCNDAHICDAGVGDGEAEVLKSDGAYLLFYIRK